MIIKYTDENSLCHWEVRGQSSGNPYRSDTGNRGRFGYAPRGDGIEEWQRINRYQEQVSFKRPNSEGGYDTIYSGVRYTPAGEARLEREKSINNAKTRKNRLEDDAVEDVARWRRDDWKSMEDTIESVQTLSGYAGKLASQIKAKPNKPIDLSGISDEDLRAVLNRARMEQEYNSIYNPPKESKAAQYVQTGSTIVGALAGAGLTGLKIAREIKGLRA